jgi:hypothetical protein
MNMFVVLVIPSFLSPPDSPIATSGTQDVIDYFTDRQDSILTLNGLLLIFAAFFFLWFLGVLQDAEGEGYGFSSVLLAGGLLFIALVLAGAAVEIVYPATIARFENFQQDAQLGFLSLALSGWVYRFAFVGMAAVIAATSVVLRSGVLPRWLGWAGLLVALVALLRFLGPLSAWLTLLWVVAVSVLMLIGGVGSTGGPRRRTVRTS